MKLLLSILLLVACVAVGAGDNRIEARAIVLEKTGKYAEACEFYKYLYTTEKVRDKKAGYLEKMAECRLKAGDTKGTVEVYRQILAEFPDIVSTQLRVVGKMKQSSDRSRQHKALRLPKASKESKELEKRLKRIVLPKLVLEETPIAEAIDKIIALGLAADKKSKKPIQAICLAERTYVSEEDISQFLELAKNGKLELQGKHVLSLRTIRLEGEDDDDEEDDNEGWGFDDDDDDDFGLGDGDDDDELTITIDCANIPLHDTFRYVCEVHGCSMAIRDNLILISGPECTMDPLSLTACRLPRSIDFDRPKEFLKDIYVFLPSTTAGDDAFVSYDKGTRLLYLYSTKRNHDVLRTHLASLEKGPENRLGISFELIEVNKETPAFIKPSYLRKLPAKDRRVVDRIAIPIASGQPSKVTISNKWKHDIMFQATVGTGYKNVRMDLCWKLVGAYDGDTKIQTKLAFNIDEGRVLHLGMKDGKTLLALIKTQKLTAVTPDEGDPEW